MFFQIVIDFMAEIGGRVKFTLQAKTEELKNEQVFSIECYGSIITIKTDYPALLSILREHLPVVALTKKNAPTEEIIELITRGSKNNNGLYFKGEAALKFDKFDDSLIEFIVDKILMMMAKISLPSKIYLHAGAVVWHGTGILVPGTSFAGKTTLIKEFIKAGAEYYSDDCIIVDDENNLLPFPRDLAVRTETGRVFRNAAHFGSKNGTAKVKVGLILFPVYTPGAEWKPDKILPGAAVLKLMDNFYYKPSISDAPREIISNLTALTRRADIYGGERGEAADVVEWVREKLKDDRRQV